MTPSVPRGRFTDLNALPLSFQLGSFSGQILGWGFFEPRWWRNYLHSHSFFEICYAFQGCGTFRMLGDDYSVQAGDVFVAKPSEPHEIISSHDDPLGIYFWSYTLVPLAERAVQSKAIDTLLDRFLASRTWVSQRARGMRQTLELLTEEVVLREPGHREAIDGLLVKLLLDTARAVTDAPPATGPAGAAKRSPAEVVAQQIGQYLRDNYSRPIAIRDVAAQVHLSERHTSRLFQQVMGVSIMEHLAALRMDVATQLLLNPTLSIKEIAEASGYPDVRHFTTVFRRQTGLTPAVFRQKGGTSFL